MFQTVLLKSDTIYIRLTVSSSYTLIHINVCGTNCVLLTGWHRIYLLPTSCYLFVCLLVCLAVCLLVCLYVCYLCCLPVVYCLFVVYLFTDEYTSVLPILRSDLENNRSLLLELEPNINRTLLEVLAAQDLLPNITEMNNQTRQLRRTRLYESKYCCVPLIAILLY